MCARAHANAISFRASLFCDQLEEMARWEWLKLL
jgi:hypothetical protein